MRFSFLLWLFPILGSGFTLLPFIKVSNLMVHKNKMNDKQAVRELTMQKLTKIDDFKLHLREGSPLRTFISKKVKGFSELSRIQKNFIPTTILIFLSGLVTNPQYVRTWIISKEFLSSFVMVHLLTSASMIINDVYDVNIDKINNPQRPLVTKTVSIKEALGMFAFLVSIYCILGFNYLSVLTPIWFTSLLGIILYTPIFKRIPLVKNLLCSSIVTMVIPFVGYSTVFFLPQLATPVPNWMLFTMELIFLHSLYIEVLLDILDEHGDKANKIYTFPVIIGKKNTFHLLLLTLVGSFYGMLFNIVHTIGITSNVKELYKTIMMIVALSVTFHPLLLNSGEIMEKKYNPEIIKNAIYTTSISMFNYMIVYLCSLFI